jgi:hypothetical protein
VFTSVLFFSFSDQLSWILPAYCVTFAIWHLFMILNMLGPLMVLMCLCPGVNAMQNEQAFPDISFKLLMILSHKILAQKLHLQLC